MLTVCDFDAARTARAAETFGATFVTGDAIIASDVDIFAPCALGDILSANIIPLLNTKIGASAANNQMAMAKDGERLAKHGVFHAIPYYATNVAAEMTDRGYDVASITPPPHRRHADRDFPAC